jgi:hypothetical protein
MLAIGRRRHLPGKRTGSLNGDSRERFHLSCERSCEAEVVNDDIRLELGVRDHLRLQLVVIDVQDISAPAAEEVPMALRQEESRDARGVQFAAQSEQRNPVRDSSLPVPRNE